jgi:hypothetical protein
VPDRAPDAGLNKPANHAVNFSLFTDVNSEEFRATNAIFPETWDEV